METGTNGTEIDRRQEKPGARFRHNVMTAAHTLLDEWVGPERAAEAVGRVATALSAVATSAKKPQDYYDCSPASVAAVVAISALTGIMVGTGPAALAYAIPRKVRGQQLLNYSLSHRGLAALARRAGTTLIAVPASAKDVFETADGEVINFAPDIDDPPTTWDELRGVVVIVKQTDTGVTLFRGWVAKKIIAIRRESSDAYRYAVNNEFARESDPWHAWPVEQSMKTALHYAVSRGWAVIDDTESMRALSADARADVIDTTGETTRVEGGAPTGRSALGITDQGGDRDPLAGIDPRDDRREKVLANGQTIETSGQTTLVQPDTKPDPRAEPTKPGPGKRALAAECKQIEGRLADELDAVETARKSADVDPEPAVSERWDEAVLLRYRDALVRAEASLATTKAKQDSGSPY